MLNCTHHFWMVKTKQSKARVSQGKSEFHLQGQDLDLPGAGGSSSGYSGILGSCSKGGVEGAAATASPKFLSPHFSQEQMGPLPSSATAISASLGHISPATNNCLLCWNGDHRGAGSSPSVQNLFLYSWIPQ